jgi:hypothetical protein
MWECLSPRAYNRFRARIRPIAELVVLELLALRACVGEAPVYWNGNEPLPRPVGPAIAVTENSEDELEIPPADQPVQDESGEANLGLPRLSEVIEALSKVVRKPRPKP